MEIRDIFADNMRAYRIRAGLTQEQLAELCGLHRTYIGRIEQKRENPTLGSVDKIARALGVDLALFFVKASGGEPPGASKRALADYGSGDRAMCTWTDDGIQFEPIPTGDFDKTLQVMEALAEDNEENLTEAYIELKKAMILKQSDAATDWLSNEGPA